MLLGAAGVAVAWRAVVRGRATIWTAMGVAAGAAGLAALATGRLELSSRVSPALAGPVGAGAGVVLYLATVAFVLVVRRWPVFDRHVDRVYHLRGGLSVGAALLLASAMVSPAEELFWRGLVQGRLEETALGDAGAAVAAWAAYVLANAASGNLPILAGAVVSGAVWGGLAWWSGGVLASVLCHVVWTALMVVAPPKEVPHPARPATAGAS